MSESIQRRLEKTIASARSEDRNSRQMAKDISEIQKDNYRMLELLKEIRKMMIVQVCILTTFVVFELLKRLI